jgi:NifU-like protein
VRRCAAPDAEGESRVRVIEDAHFQTFGCGSAIASSSALTEIIKGKTLDEALKVSNQDIADYLDGLPPEKMHCSVMGREALQAAVANYRGEVWSDDHEEGDLVCKCFAIDAVMIEEVVRGNSLKTMEDVTNYTKAGGGCSACHEKIEDILIAVNGRLYSNEPKAKKAPKESPKCQAAAHQLPAHPQDRGHAGGDPPHAATRSRRREPGRGRRQEDLRCPVKGACQGCQMEAATLGGIQHKLVEALGELVQVLPVAAMASLKPRFRKNVIALANAGIQRVVLDSGTSA